MKSPTGPKRSRHGRHAFTLVELLVVIVIISIVAIATLAVAIPAYQHRGVTQAALLLQSSLAGARDAAIRANAPRGIRLVPDAILRGPTPGDITTVAIPLASSRLVPIELAPDYSAGFVTALVVPNSTFAQGISALTAPPTTLGVLGQDPRLFIQEELFQDEALPVNPALPPAGTIPNPPTEWFWNIRQGERFRFADAGRYYYIAGPMFTPNPERFVNADTATARFVSLPPSSNVTPPAGTTTGPEFLFLVNGQDDDHDGFVDNSFDGIDNDGDGLVDPGFNGIDDDKNGIVDDQNEVFLRIIGGSMVYDTRLYNGNGGIANTPPGYNPEFEAESAPNLPGLSFLTSIGTFVNKPYTILRRAVPTQGAREVVLPAGTVVDLTTYNASVFSTNTQVFVPERSRLPIDPISKYTDILISPNGTIFRSDAASNNAPIAPFYHFWIAERDDVFSPLFTTGVPYLLPMPAKSLGYPNTSDISGRVLKGDRRLVSVFTKTGQIVTNTIEQFDGTGSATGGVSLPFFAPQQGVRDVP
jgi:prepilin-type N-terminal cleavage/methylation domain-containing protein